MITIKQKYSIEITTIKLTLLPGIFREQVRLHYRALGALDHQV